MRSKNQWTYFISASVLCVLWTLYAGKDTNWDFFHYHVYAAENALNSRILQDHLAAGPQSLTNPYAFLLLGGLLQWNPPAWAFGSIIALLQSSALWLIWGIAKEVIPNLRESDTSNRLLLAAMLLAGANPLFLSQLGTTFADLLTAIPALAGIWLVLKGVGQVRSTIFLIVGGMLLGLSVGLKLSNVLLVVSFWLAFLVFSNSSIGGRYFNALLMGGAIVLGFLVVAGPWAFQVWRLTGNPFYPFLTGWLGAVDLPLGADRHMRFAAESLSEFITLPWRLALPLKGIYVEGSLPDARYILFVLILTINILLFLGSKRLKALKLPNSIEKHHARKILTGAIVGQYILWVWLSGNGRYILSLSLLLGVLLVAWYPRQEYFRKGLGFILVVLVIGIQIMQFTFGAGLRWSSVPWASRWMEVDVPAALTQRPHLYVGLELQSESWLASFVHRESSFTLPVGQQAIALYGRGGERLQKLYGRFGGDILVLTRVTPAISQPEVHENFRRELNYRISRLGLYSPVDSACFSIRRHDSLPLEFRIPFEKIGKQIHTDRGVDVGDAARKASGFSLPDRSNEQRETAYYLADSLIADPYLHWISIYACPARLSIQAYESHERQVSKIDQALSIVEAACPKLFSPQPSITERDGADSWSRFYAATDMRLVVDRGRILYQDSFRQGAMIEIGTVNGWLSGSDQLLLDCNKKYQAPTPLILEGANSESR
jgi:hypothetical protein